MIHQRPERRTSADLFWCEITPHAASFSPTIDADFLLRHELETQLQHLPQDTTNEVLNRIDLLIKSCLLLAVVRLDSILVVFVLNSCPRMIAMTLIYYQ
jgi:hypothetical protein